MVGALLMLVGIGMLAVSLSIPGLSLFTLVLAMGSGVAFAAGLCAIVEG